MFSRESEYWFKMLSSIYLSIHPSVSSFTQPAIQPASRHPLDSCHYLGRCFGKGFNPYDLSPSYDLCLANQSLISIQPLHAATELDSKLATHLPVGVESLLTGECSEKL